MHVIKCQLPFFVFLLLIFFSFFFFFLFFFCFFYIFFFFEFFFSPQDTEHTVNSRGNTSTGPPAGGLVRVTSLLCWSAEESCHVFPAESSPGRRACRRPLLSADPVPFICCYCEAPLYFPSCCNIQSIITLYILNRIA